MLITTALCSDSFIWYVCLTIYLSRKRSFILINPKDCPFYSSYAKKYGIFGSVMHNCYSLCRNKFYLFAVHMNLWRLSVWIILLFVAPNYSILHWREINLLWYFCFVLTDNSIDFSYRLNHIVKLCIDLDINV